MRTCLCVSSFALHSVSIAHSRCIFHYVTLHTWFFHSSVGEPLGGFQGWGLLWMLVPLFLGGDMTAFLLVCSCEWNGWITWNVYVCSTLGDTASFLKWLYQRFPLFVKKKQIQLGSAGAWGLVISWGSWNVHILQALGIWKLTSSGKPAGGRRALYAGTVLGVSLTLLHQILATIPLDELGVLTPSYRCRNWGSEQ